MTRSTIGVPVAGSPTITAGYTGPLTSAIVDLLSMREEDGDPATEDLRKGGIWSNLTLLEVRQCIAVTPGVVVGSLGARGQRWDWHEAQDRREGVTGTVTIPGIWTPPAAAFAYSLAIVSDTATSGSNGSNRYTFQIVNYTQTLNLLATAWGTDGSGGGSEFAVKTTKVVVFDQNRNVNTNDVLDLVITKTGTPTDWTTVKLKFILRAYLRGLAA